MKCSKLLQLSALATIGYTLLGSNFCSSASQTWSGYLWQQLLQQAGKKTAQMVRHVDPTNFYTPLAQAIGKIQLYADGNPNYLTDDFILSFLPADYKFNRPEAMDIDLKKDYLRRAKGIIQNEATSYMQSLEHLKGKPLATESDRAQIAEPVQFLKDRIKIRLKELNKEIKKSLRNEKLNEEIQSFLRGEREEPIFESDIEFVESETSGEDKPPVEDLRISREQQQAPKQTESDWEVVE